MDYSRLKLASDIEAKGFYDDVHDINDIHCLCSIDIKTEEVYLFHDHPELDLAEVVDPYDGKTYIIPKRTGSLDEGIKFWENVGISGGSLIIHNARTYDQPIIDKVWEGNKIPYEAYHDTYIQSKVQWFERPTPKGSKGAHGLDAYARRKGIHKPDVKDWSFIDAFKLHRCIEDCKIQAYTYDVLEKERYMFNKTYEIDFTQALKIENLYATECFNQEKNGALVDVKHIERCIIDLDNKIENLRYEIEPKLPPTLKAKGPKVSRKEMYEIFGYDSSKVIEETYQKKSNGSIVDAVVKDYYKPTTKFTRTIKSNYYEGYHIDLGGSPTFEVKKELTQWIKDNHPDTKPKEWVIDKTEKVYEEIDANNCKFFQIQPNDTDYLCGPHTKIDITPSTMTQDVVVKSFLIQLGWKWAEEWNLKKDINGDFIKVDKKTVVHWPDGAPEGKRLEVTIPKGGYMVSSPKLGEKDYEQLPEGLGKKIAEYNTYQHRRRFLSNPKDPENKGLLSFVREDGRIPCGVNNFGTRSGRGAQRVFVNAPGAKSLYGKEIRECIVAGEGNVLVGVDMKSAQLSIAAYYANNKEYYDNVASGIEETEDGLYVGETAHCVNARMFGVVSEEEWRLAVETQDKELIEKLTLIRGHTKGGSFAVIFGASGKKVARTIGIPEEQGHARKEQFLKQMGLQDTIKQLSVFESKYKFRGGFMLPLAFGYWLYNDSSHKSVNTIVQGFEALAQKMAVIRTANEIKRAGLQDKAAKVLEMHDEVLYEVKEGYQDAVADIINKAYTWAPLQVYNYHVKNPEQFANSEPPMFPIDLSGGAKFGSNYYDVH